MEELTKARQELERTKSELAILYEISNAMRTTLKLDEILYIILTGVTAHIGLGFNRAVLFLVNEKDGLIEGKIAIGPESGEEAGRIWRYVEQEKMDLDDMINAYKVSGKVRETKFNQEIQHIKIPLNEQKNNLLALCVLEGMPLHLTRETVQNYAADQVIQLLRPEEVAIVPLKAKDKVNGIILADNFITKKPITKDDVRMLIMLANQAGLAIENSHLYEKTLITAHQDSLTNIWNHGYFQYLLSVELERAKATATPLSLVMLDIDDFKAYNDSGHQAGDMLLKEIALLLKNQSRKMDYVCRYGGEEFSIILPYTDKKEAFQISDRLRENIAKHFAGREHNGHSVTASLGLATFPKNGATPSDLIAYSDRALYEAKHKGKNATCG